ncbi:Major facilitator superfamily domain [Phytophthora cactorum]|nr:Major facilitator superfamily domain [Phytophthora cactorum]
MKLYLDEHRPSPFSLLGVVLLLKLDVLVGPLGLFLTFRDGCEARRDEQEIAQTVEISLYDAVHVTRRHERHDAALSPTADDSGHVEMRGGEAAPDGRMKHLIGGSSVSISSIQYSSCVTLASSNTPVRRCLISDAELGRQVDVGSHTRLFHGHTDLSVELVRVPSAWNTASFLGRRSPEKSWDVPLSPVLVYTFMPRMEPKNCSGADRGVRMASKTGVCSVRASLANFNEILTSYVLSSWVAARIITRPLRVASYLACQTFQGSQATMHSLEHCCPFSDDDVELPALPIRLTSVATTVCRPMEERRPLLPPRRPSPAAVAHSTQIYGQRHEDLDGIHKSGTSLRRSSSGNEAYDAIMQLSQPLNPLQNAKIRLIVIWLVTSCILFLTNQLTTLPVGFYPSYATKSGIMTPAELSIFFSVYPLCIMLSSPLAASVSPTVGRQTLICLGLMLSGTSTIAFGYATGTSSAFLLRIIQGFGSGAAVVGSFSMISEEFSSHVGQVLAIQEFVVAAAFVTAPPLGSYLYETQGYEMPFLVSGVAQIVVVIIVPFVFIEYSLPDGIYAAARTGPASGSLYRTPSFSIVRYKDVLTPTCVICLAATTFAMSSFGFIDPYLGTHLHKVLGAEHVAVGLGFALSAFVYFLGCGTALTIAPGLPLTLASVQDKGIHGSNLVIGLFAAAIYLGQALGPFVAYVLMQILPVTRSLNCTSVQDNPASTIVSCDSSLPWAFAVYSVLTLGLFAFVAAHLPTSEATAELLRQKRKRVPLMRQPSEYGQFVCLTTTRTSQTRHRLLAHIHST